MTDFEEVVRLLNKYKEKNGNCLVPRAYITEEGIRLGYMVHDIRSGSRKTTEEERTILNNLGFVWKINESPLPFEEVVRLLSEYKEKHGNCLVPHAYITEEGIRLGHMVHAIRSGSRKTTEEKRTILNNLGFVWKAKESPLPFEEVIRLLNEYKAKNGNCLVPQAYITEEGIRLGEIVRNIRSGHKKTTEEERTILNSLGFAWKINESPLPFEEVVRLLNKYKEKNGNCSVPQAYITEEGIALGLIVKSIRSGHKKTTEEEREILDNIGFVWQKHLPFEEVVRLLSEYKAKNGNCLVPQTYITEEGIALGLIISMIRAGGRKTTEEEKAMLDSLGFVWKINESPLPFEEVIRLLSEYKAKNGNCLVPCRYITEEGIRLGTIVHNIRHGQRKTTEEEKAILDSIGFVWKVRRKK